MTEYFKLTPISDPPKKDGWYKLSSPGLFPLNSICRHWSEKSGWASMEHVSKQYTHYLAPLAEPVEGMRWRNIPDVKPPKDVEVFFDGGENPPVWGRYGEGLCGGYVITVDSSGEEDWLPIEDFIRWLDESSAPSAREALERFRNDTKQLIEIIERFKYGESSSIFDAVSSFKKQHNL